MIPKQKAAIITISKILVLIDGTRSFRSKTKPAIDSSNERRPILIKSFFETIFLAALVYFFIPM